MKAVLPKINGSHTASRKKDSTSGASSGEKKEQSFSGVLTSGEEDKKEEITASGKAAKGQASKEDKKKGEGKKGQPDETVFPFTLIVSGMKLKAVIAKITGGKPKETGKKVLSDITKKGKQQTKTKAGHTGEDHTDKTTLKGKGKHIKALVIKKNAHKADDVKLEPVVNKAVNKQSGKAKDTRSGSNNKDQPKGKISSHKSAAGSDLPSQKVIKRPISKGASLLEGDTSTVKDHQTKQNAADLKGDAKSKQATGNRFQLTESAKLGRAVRAPKKPESKIMSESKRNSGGKIKGRPNELTPVSSKSASSSGSKNQITTAALHPQSAQNTTSPQHKPHLNGSFMPGKQLSDQLPPGEIKMDANTRGTWKDKTKHASNKAHSSGLNSAHLTGAAGRKMFSKQLAQQVSQPQLNRQAASASKQAAAWKHHRLMLKDGNTIHIASRTSNGALQLQLNAGNGQLGKVLQQHLQEIQQHVQQQLNININLQLNDSGGQQQSGGQSESPTPKRTKEKLKTEEMVPVGHSDYGINAPQVRYFGFNQNEWTA